MIFVDSNVPMYLVGTDHPNKAIAQSALERVIADGESLVTDAEVFQEILHRYVAIDTRDAIQPAFDVLRGVIDEIFSIEIEVVERAKEVVQGRRQLSARDALHVSVMEREGVERILTFDRGFDVVPGIKRIPT